MIAARLPFLLSLLSHVLLRGLSLSLSLSPAAPRTCRTSIKMLSGHVNDKAKQWSDWDPNEGTASHVQHLLEQVKSNVTQTSLLDKYFGNPERIAFGTAGLRGPMHPGPHGMNDLTIVQATQGVAKFALNNYDTSPAQPTAKPRAIIGYDHRAISEEYSASSVGSYQLSSRQFALYATVVLQEAGFDVLLLQHPALTIGDQSDVPVFSPTPLVAFGVNYLNTQHQQQSTGAGPCLVGLMITASHNPKQDNGYKLYWRDGCQIRPPVDDQIASQIEQNLKPWHSDYHAKVKSCDSDDEARQQSLLETQQVVDAYYHAIKHQSGGLYRDIGPSVVQPCLKHEMPTSNSTAVPKIVYTAMHGVGTPWIMKVFEAFDIPPPHIVPQQSIVPDPSFPTVAFPNPEEKGALTLAMDFVAKERATVNVSDAAAGWVILANDPDADRLAVAEYDPIDNRWRNFTGDETGVMLGHWLWTQVGVELKAKGKTVAMCASTVSSKMLGAIAVKEGFIFEETLTGFKYIGSHSQQLRDEKGYHVLLGYEEAIGYCCGDGFVKDKDGVTAAAVFAELTYDTYLEQQTTLKAHMQTLYDKYGEFVASNGYFICYDNDIVHRIFDRIRNEGNYMWDVAGYKVSSIRDLGEPGYDSTQPDNCPTLPTSASSPLLALRFENGCVLQMRASGTEPKFKYYIEMRGKAGVEREKVESDLEAMKRIVLEELFQPSLNGLKEP
jgi:phosphomannomutase